MPEPTNPAETTITPPASGLFEYERVVYPDHWHTQTYPDRLATIATLFGLQPASPERCRVLELGCGGGWNLVAMAHGLPGSTFVGVDLAAGPLERGRQLAQQLGLQNVSLQALDLMDVDDAFGTFDYVVAHGLYSWVPAAVRDRLLALCKARLAPQGVAYVSYNTYPGKYLPRAMRESMLYYCRRFDDPRERAGHARAFLRFLRDAQKEGSFERQLLDREVERVEKLPDNYFYHDDLAEINEPCYFRDFVAHAAAHGLQFLGEANFHEMSDMTLPDKVAEVCRGLAQDHNDWEQYLDLVVQRQFRQTLLCHDEAAVSRAPDPERMRAFYVAAPVAEASDVSFAGEAAATFRGFHPEAVLQTDDPLLAAALQHLRARWPVFEPLDALVDAARRELSRTHPGRTTSREDDLRVMGLTVLRLYGSRFLSLRVRRPPVEPAATERPEASALVRLQVQGTRSVSSAVGEDVKVTDPLERLLLPLLDGTRDRHALVDALLGLAEEGAFVVEQDGAPVADPSSRRQLLGLRLEEALQHLAHQGLFTS